CWRCASQENFQTNQSSEVSMDHLRKSELEAKLRQALKEHQHEGLNMIGSADQLLHRLVEAVEEWSEGDFISQQKSA
ncbi:MAG TPA: hypothetical protein VGP89_06975, partial [Candidatus Angelobacter sp.]|nr:hypothetical protein [Candidatus Angelobacter sp.]